MAQVAWVDPLTAVFDDQEDFAVLCIAPNADLAAVLNGMRCVDQHVDQNLADFACVADDLGQILAIHYNFTSL